MIAEPLRPLARPIGQFRLLEGNPRLGDVESVKRSLARFGQRKPIVVRDDGTVEAGNTTLRAALELGWDEIAAVAFGDDEATAKAFALADNRTSELGAFDLAALAAMAGGVHAADPDLLNAASFSVEDLQAWDRRLNPPPPDEFPEYDEDIDVEYQCPKCGYRGSGNWAVKDITSLCLPPANAPGNPLPPRLPPGRAPRNHPTGCHQWQRSRRSRRTGSLPCRPSPGAGAVAWECGWPGSASAGRQSSSRPPRQPTGPTTRTPTSTRGTSARYSPNRYSKLYN